VNSAALTGFDFTDIPEVLERAGRATGISFYKDGQYSTSFFSRSDNASFADMGIPSTTLAVAFVYPDYHEPGDTWQKIDYENMAHIDRAVALALIRLANAADPPRWNTSNPEALHYAEISAKHARPAVAPN
jgi:Zn-dependent M28 family amino/carboxypeptidase